MTTFSGEKNGFGKEVQQTDEDEETYAYKAYVNMALSQNQRCGRKTTTQVKKERTVNHSNAHTLQ